MRKLWMLVVIAVIGLAVWRWRGSEGSEGGEGEAGEAAIERSMLFNRFWIDHLPQGEKDTVRVFALWQPESFGVFADRNAWRVELERFRYEASGDKVRAIWPLSGQREELTVKAQRCQVEDWDFCLEIEGTSRGVKRYYSRLGWERRDRSVDAFVAELPTSASAR